MVTHVLNLEVLKQGRQEAHLQGKKEGKLEGKLEGMIEGQVEVLLTVLEALGVQDEKMTEIIKHQTDLSKLKRWSVLAATRPIHHVKSEIYKAQA